MGIAGRTLISDVNLFYVAAFSNIYKKKCQRQRHARFRAKYVTVSHIIKWPTLKNFIRFSVSLYVFMLFSVIFSMKSFRKYKNNDHTCLFQCIHRSRASRK